jgi:hypothetical protein
MNFSLHLYVVESGLQGNVKEGGVSMSAYNRKRAKHRPASLAAVLCLAISLGPTSGFAEEPDAIAFPSKLTILLVDETDACPPGGYVSYPLSIDKVSIDLVSSTASCPMDPNAVKTLRDQLPAFDARDCELTGSNVVNLGPGLMNALRRTSKQYLNGPHLRKSIVFQFEWKGGASADVTFEREAAGNIPGLKVPGRLDDQRRFVVHQRADAALPANSVWFRLTVNGKTWRFTMEE